MNDGASNVALTVSGTTGVATATGLIGVVNEYSTVIGLALSLISICMALFFHYRTSKWRAQQSAQDLKTLRAEIIAELKKDQDSNAEGKSNSDKNP